ADRHAPAQINSQSLTSGVSDPRVESRPPGNRLPRPAAHLKRRISGEPMRTQDQPTLAFYTEPASMTSAGRYAPLLQTLPADVPSLAATVQGLLIHEYMAHGYGVTLSEQDKSSVHIRPVEQLLAEIVARDSRPLEAPRPPAARLPVNCRHFT